MELYVIFHTIPIHTMHCTLKGSLNLSISMCTEAAIALLGKLRHPFLKEIYKTVANIDPLNRGRVRCYGAVSILW